nr:FkbM family methyltransferase [Herbaspirillum sp. ASV7]
MSLGLALRRLAPQSLKHFLRQNTLPRRISRQLSPHLPTVVCVDVGASYYPHAKWLQFLNAPNTQWLAVEPNEANIGYVKSWIWPSQVSACTTGLSRDGGIQTLYVTNVDTGSSLLPPEITPSMQHRITDLDYFFPVTERRIETLTLAQAIDGLSANAPVFVKLDTQGTELSILQGAQHMFDNHRIVGIEMESTMLAQPLMKNSGKFWQASEYLEEQGFELLHIKPIAAVARSPKGRPHRNTFVNECDAVFALRRDVAAGLPVEFRTSLLAFYLTNLFYEEAVSFMEQDNDVTAFLSTQGCNVDALLATLRAAI